MTETSRRPFYTEYAWAFDLLDPEDPAVRAGGGCTALMLMMKAGVLRPARLTVYAASPVRPCLPTARARRAHRWHMMRRRLRVARVEVGSVRTSGALPFVPDSSSSGSHRS